MPDDPTAPAVLFEQRGRVALLTLNRPERLNAWGPEMAAGLYQHISRANEDRGIGAIVITGAGRGFCSGADLSGQRPAGAAAGAVAIGKGAGAGAPISRPPALNHQAPAPASKASAAPPRSFIQGKDARCDGNDRISCGIPESPDNVARRDSRSCSIWLIRLMLSTSPHTP